jgi:hypothetical protein
MADSEWRIVWERATTLLHAQALHIDPYLTPFDQMPAFARVSTTRRIAVLSWGCSASN